MTTPLLSFLRVKRIRDYPSRDWRMAIAAVSTISSAVAPRDRSEIGRANPWRIGPSAIHPRSCSTPLGAIRKERDDRLVPHDAAAFAGGRHGDVRELRGIGFGADGG